MLNHGLKTSEAGLSQIKNFEGLRLTAYKCPSGIPTIGYGHTKGVTESQVGHAHISESEAEDLLRQDISVFEVYILRMVKVVLTQHQFDALVSFVFNVGVGAFSKSTLLEVLNKGQYEEVPGQLRRWNKGSNKKVLPGLTTRREAECQLWNS